MASPNGICGQVFHFGLPRRPGFVKSVSRGNGLNPDSAETGCPAAHRVPISAQGGSLHVLKTQTRQVECLEIAIHYQLQRSPADGRRTHVAAEQILGGVPATAVLQVGLPPTNHAKVRRWGLRQSPGQGGSHP